ncbi:uncharacterized protein VP01_9g7 [Puccinia sorghi]|uniref:RWD domain-containing protein n=1 Tax=Puccinia sorghi TaxID=27349 RepID=A0A0L6U548_9BASI|nr:uncharacterized protein VP01_9g7 [Puccinia sorghi]
MVALLRPISYLVERLEGGGSRPELAVELSTLEAILGEESVHCELGEEAGELSSISLLIDLHLNNTLENDDDDDDDDVQCQLRLEIPDQYPSTQEPPRVRLLAKYLGPFKVTHELLEAITNVFVNLPSSSPADSILYDGIQNAKDILSDFYLRNLHRRASSPSNKEPPTTSLTTPEHATESHDPHLESSLHNDRPDAKQVVVFSSDPIVDRKSVFIGHSVALEDPKDVSPTDSAAPPRRQKNRKGYVLIIWSLGGASSTVFFTKVAFSPSYNDDDGESAAGSRMAHLLNILDVKNVFVCVSRWFGGIHLGPDRFKHINQATRDALVTGGFIVSGSKLAGHQAHAASHGLVPKKKKR